MTAANVEFKRIDPELYRHPGEREAMSRLGKIPGFSKALGMMSDGSGGQAERQAEIASMLRVGPGVYPALADMWTDTLARFGLGEVPLHIAFGLPAAWSLRGGNDHPVLVLSVDLLDLLLEREMAALLAGQAGVIRLGNVSTVAAADFLRWLSDFSGLAAAPAAVLAWGIENWRRAASFSSDRAAALAMGGPEAVVDLLERLSGGGSGAWGGVVDAERVRLQGLEARSLDNDWGNTRWRRFAMAMNRQNHVGLIRRIDLLDWFATGEPGRILAGEITKPAEPKPEAEKESANARPEGTPDPSLAYWGEFASAEPPPGWTCDTMQCPMAQLMNWAGKGLDSFWKAGEAFVGTLRDQGRREKK